MRKNIMRLLFVLAVAGSLYYLKAQSPKISELDQAKVQNKFDELVIKDLQTRLTSQIITSYELQIQLLRKESATYQSELKDLSTYYNSYLVALVTRYKLDPAKWTYDLSKKEFVLRIPPKP